MTVLQLFPDERDLSLDQLKTVLESIDHPHIAPFDNRLLEACAAFSEALMRDQEARRVPELQALAFHFRRSNLARFKVDFDALRCSSTMLVPRGIVFHIPPRNVDPVLIYSWMYAALCGNNSIIRVSANRAPVAEIILRVFRAAFGDNRAIRESTVIVEYKHEAEVTDLLSSVCDLRVIWGGDTTVESIRRSPLPPHARDVTFTDKTSLCLVGASEYLALDTQQRIGLTSRFFNDAYSFSQMACSSPRCLIWRGAPSDSEAASQLFFADLQTEITKRAYTNQLSVAMNAFVFGCRTVVDQGSAVYKRYSNELGVIRQHSLHEVSNHCGGGVLLEYLAASVLEIVHHIQRKHQTLTHFGISASELKQLLGELNGRGIDRVVPVGQALEFGRLWDGYDLYQEMTKRVHLICNAGTARLPEAKAQSQIAVQ